jgi:RNA polymerase sigma-70 factor (ECF subfamily)
LSTDFQNIDERTLFLRIAEGSEAAFTDLYRSYVPLLSSYLTRLTRSRTTVDELIQETFLQIWLQRDKLPEVEFPRAWIFRIASNITFNYLKRLLTEEKARTAVNNSPVADRNEVEEAFYLQQLLNAIGEAVSQLSPQRKKVYQLSREAGMTIPEIADHLGLSVSTVKNTLVSSLQFIRESLLQKGYYTGGILFFLLFF